LFGGGITSGNAAALAIESKADENNKNVVQEGNKSDSDEFGDFGDFDQGTTSTPVVVAVAAPASNAADPLSDVFGTSVV